MGFHECLLGDVGGVVDRTGDRRSQPQRGVLIPTDERAKGSVVAGAGASDKIGVGWFCLLGGHGRRVARLDTSGVREVPHATIGTLCAGPSS